MGSSQPVVLRVRGILFDMDGVLVSSIGAVERSWEKWSARHGLDPARAIEAALTSANTPLRLQLGEDAITAVRSHAETLLSDMKQWEKTGLDTRLD